MGFRVSSRALVLAVLAGACAWAGSVFGLFAFYVFSVALVALLILGIGTCAYGTRKSWRVIRSISPAPATAGDELRISMVAAPSRVFAPTMLLQELTPKGNRQFGLASSGRRSAPIAVSWPGDARTRGIFEAGPGALYRHDALGMFRRKVMDIPLTAIVVHPRSTDIDPAVFADVLVHTNGRALDLGNAHGDLREYVPGDDPRRVNWKVSARTMSMGSLMVTDSERTQRDSQMSIEIQLDSLPASSTTSGPFENADREIAVSAAASILRAFAHAEPPVAHTFTIRFENTVRHSSSELNTNLDALALIESFEPNSRSGDPIANGTDPAERDEEQHRITPTVLITGSGGHQCGIVTLRCGNQQQPSAQQDPAGQRLSRAVHTLRELPTQLDSLRESLLR